jgi:pre-mRNA-splicing factor SPF27
MEQLQLLYLENESYHLVDALPYIDTDYGASAEISMAVQRVIDEEMKSMPKKDYLAKLPLPATPHMDESPIFKEAAQRVATNKKMDVIHGYDVTAPQGMKGREVKAWEEAVAKAERKAAYDDTHAVNMDLMATFGKPAWMAHVNHGLEYEKVLRLEATNMRGACEEVNKRRKLEQISCGNQLRGLLRQAEELERNTYEVDGASAMLEVDVARLKRFAKERGVLPAEFIEEVKDGVEGAIEA